VAAQGDELGTALILLGGTGLALVMGLSAICSLFQQREQQTGRPFSEEERQILLALASSVPALEDRLASVEGTLESMANMLETLVHRNRRGRATDA
jgi:TolA-binding protein